MDAQKFNRLICRMQFDGKAVELLYQEYYPKIKLHIKRKFGKLVCAEDVAQECFAQMMSGKVVEYIHYPTSWVYGMADNVAKGFLKKEHPDNVPLDDSVATTCILDSIVMREDIHRAMQKLSEEEQRILYLHHWEGYQYAEIAQQLGLSVGCVRTKVSRAYKNLKKFL